eukprot:scpid87519/ scgid12369/ 
MGKPGESQSTFTDEHGDIILVLLCMALLTCLSLLLYIVYTWWMRLKQARDKARSGTHHVAMSRRRIQRPPPNIRKLPSKYRDVFSVDPEGESGDQDSAYGGGGGSVEEDSTYSGGGVDEDNNNTRYVYHGSWRSPGVMADYLGVCAH